MTTESQGAWEASQAMSLFALQWIVHIKHRQKQISRKLHGSAVIHLYPTDRLKAPMVCNAALK